MEGGVSTHFGPLESASSTCWVQWRSLHLMTERNPFSETLLLENVKMVYNVENDIQVCYRTTIKNI
jgi:hypothetical protein